MHPLSVLDWLLIGGGVHGTHLSLALTAGLGWRRARVRVLDPHTDPLAVWSYQTASTGMAFMRSSRVHHLALDPLDLLRFAKTPDGASVARFAAPYGRPGYALFQRHAAATVTAHRLDDLRLRGRAARLERRRGGWRVETDRGAVDARRVLLAPGLGEQPAWPAWARALRAAGGTVHHLFDPDFRRDDVAEGAVVAVVGGGISAAQASVALATRGPVLLLSRHTTRVSQLDADPGWLGPRHLRGYWSETCLVRRRAAISAARQRGSVPPDALRAVQRAVRAGTLARATGDVVGATVASGGRLRLAVRLSTGETVERVADRVVLATGFEVRRPGDAWLDAAVDAEGLPLAPCGYPRVAPSLAWAPGLYASGALAELELGPVARNIAGARMAAGRLPPP